MGLKVPPYTITTITNQDCEFYFRLGPFLSRREVVAELGAPVWDDDNKVWLIAHTDDLAWLSTHIDEPQVLGFLSVVPGDTASIRSLYVRPEVRGDVIGGTLVIRALATWPDVPFKATATEASVELFTECGFTECGQRGRYTLFERDADAPVG